MVVMMVAMVAVSRRHHDDAGRISAIEAVMVMMVMIAVELCQLDVFVR